MNMSIIVKTNLHITIVIGTAMDHCVSEESGNKVYYHYYYYHYYIALICSLCVFTL